MLVRRTPNNMDRIFNEWNRAINNANTKSLALDVHENEDGFTIVADLPGMESDNIDIRLHDDVLTITAEYNDETVEERGNMVLQERHNGKMSRSLRFPVNVNSDAVLADFNNGVLSISVPKAEEIKPRRIEINHA